MTKSLTSIPRQSLIITRRGWFRGRGGEIGRPPPPLRDSTPFDTFLEIHFWPTDPKIFLKAPLAPIYTNFEGERAPKNAVRKFSQNRGKTVLWGSSKNQLGGPKKKRLSKFWKIFWKSAPPPRENPRSAPDYTTHDNNLGWTTNKSRNLRRKRWKHAFFSQSKPNAWLHFSLLTKNYRAIVFIWIFGSI